jgi:hypothetical protein
MKRFFAYGEGEQITQRAGVDKPQNGGCPFPAVQNRRIVPYPIPRNSNGCKPFSQKNIPDVAA